MTQQFFADGISEITVAAGVVRMEYFVFQKGGGTPEKQPLFTLLMPIEGFANSIPGLQDLFDKMLKDGIIKQRALNTSKPSSGSPNFS